MVTGSAEEAALPGLLEARALVAEQLRAAARLAGVTAVLGGPSEALGPDGVRSDAEAGYSSNGWQLAADGTVTVDPGYFLTQGDSPREAAYAVLVELWAVVREARRAPRLVSRRRALTVMNPVLGPLLGALVRGAAVWELTSALPGFCDLAELRAARVLASAGPLPRHLQYAAELTRAAFARGQDPAAIESELAPEVAAELAALRNLGGAGDAIQELLSPVRLTSEDRLDRQLAVFAPPYFRLLELDAEDRGALGASSRPIADADDPGGGAEDLAPGHGGDEAQRADPAGESADDAPAVPADQDEQSGPETPSPAKRRAPAPQDLFQIERDGFIATVLDSPISASEALTTLLLEQTEQQRAQQEDAERDPASARSRDALLRATTGAGLAAHERYVARTLAFAEPIARTRALWRRVISERVTQRRALGRRAHPDGEVLSPWSLARAVIDARSGMPRPAAFARYEPRIRIGLADGRTDYAFAIDRSGSMQGRAARAASDAALVMLEALAGAARDVADAERLIDRDLDLELRTALFVYDSEPVCVKPLSAGLDDGSRVRLDSEIRSVGGSTNDAAALDAVGEVFTDPARRRIAIIISDGGTNDDAAAHRALTRLRAAGVIVWGIGVASEAVVARYAPHSRRVERPDQLVAAIHDLIEELTT